jgi:hypothetical protein
MGLAVDSKDKILWIVLILYTYLMMKTGCSLVISTFIDLTRIETEKGDVYRTS